MSFRLVAFHYPKSEHREELLQRLHRAAEIMKRSPGCIDVEVWREQGFCHHGEVPVTRNLPQRSTDDRAHNGHPVR